MRRFALASFAAGIAFLACGSDHADTPVVHSPISKPTTSEPAVLPGAPASAFFPVNDGYDAWGTGAKRIPSYKAHVDAKTGELSFTLAKRRGHLGLRTVSIGGKKNVGARVSLTGGAVTIDHGIAVERLVADERSLEQSFTFDERPPGEGPLVVRIRASGVGLRAESNRIVAENVRYRDAAWIGKNGRRTPLPVKLEDDTIVLEVPARVLDEGGFPATLDPTIGAELEVDKPTVGVHGLGASYPQIATGKDGAALVVWADSRVASVGGNSLFSSEHLLGARISAAGAILDPTGIPVAKERDFSFEDWKVVYDGTKNWFVPWFQSGFNSPCDELWGSVVSDTGEVLSTKSTQGACNGNFVAAGFDGTSWVVGFQTNNYYVTRFSPAGEPLDILPKMVASGTTQIPNLGCRPGGCLAAWKLGTEIRAARIGPGLAVLDSTPLVLKTGSSSSERVNGIAFDGTNWIIGWGNLLARVDPATGTVLGTTALSGAVITSVAATPAGSWGAWSNASQVVAGRMDPSGAALAGWPVQVTTTAIASLASVAATTTQGFVAWEDQSRNTFGDVLATRVSNAGAVLDGTGLVLSKTASTQRMPAVASSGNGFLVAWGDFRAPSGVEGAYAMRLDANGVALDASATLLDPVGSVPAVASDGTDYLAAWRSNTTFRAARISGTTGAVLGTAVDLATDGNAYRATIAAACDGTQYVVAWIQNGVTAVRMSKAGSVIGSPVMLDGAVGAGEGILAGAAAGNGSTLVVWNARNEVRAARIDTAGQVLDATPIKVAPVVGATNKFYPRVAWEGSAWIVAWEDYRAGHIINPDVYAARVAPDGTLLAPAEIAIANGPNAELFPAVAGMNDGYSDLVVWSEPRDPNRYQDFDLIGAFVRKSDGKILDPGGIVLSSRVGNEVGAVTAPAGPGRALLVYQATDYSSGQGTSRIRARFVGSGGALGATCTKDDDCISRACSDGVCCDRACNGVCETCGGTGGKCTPVTSGEDPGTCAGDDVCVAAGVCKRKTGRGCVSDADCISGACSGGLCCERPCNGACETCAPVTGTCTLRPARAAGAPACAPYACDGTSTACPTTCTSNDACPTGSRCDRATSVCISGGVCLDHRTAAREDETTVDCAPYACTASACRTSCRSVADCVSPAVCDEAGRCVPPRSFPTAAGGGCAMAPEPSRSGLGLGLAIVALAALRARNGTRRRA